MHLVTVSLSLTTFVAFWFPGECFLLGHTCLNRCHRGLHSTDDYSCQCNQQCTKYNDCCDDYQALCVDSVRSCQGRCHDAASTNNPCQCNSHCVRYNDCCPDYNILCVDSTPSSGTCKTLAQMGQALWDSDVTRLSSSDVTTNYQTKVADGTSDDASAKKFFTHVDETKLNSTTFSAFFKLLDNYYPLQTSTEHASSHETSEMYAFLDAVLDTKVMATLLDFLVCESKVTSKTDLRSSLKKIWFDFYKRSYKYAYQSTSGFEHILVGEYKNSTIVSGFHSWLSFYQKEMVGQINYLGYVSRADPDIVGAAFTWNGRLKMKGTFFVGTSPEFDMALYTMCYFMHKDDICRLTIGGNSIAIRTYDSDGHIATAFVL